MQLNILRTTVHLQRVRAAPGIKEHKWFMFCFLWLGLQEALIHLGAKFSPCMRQDQQVHDLIQEKMEKERHSACCVRNDRSGSVQTSEEECSVRTRLKPACASALTHTHMLYIHSHTQETRSKSCSLPWS